MASQVRIRTSPALRERTGKFVPVQISTMLYDVHTMSEIQADFPSLVVEWSPTAARVFDPADGQSLSGASLAKAIGVSKSGRTAVFAIARGSSFVRSMAIPGGRNRPTAKTVSRAFSP